MIIQALNEHYEWLKNNPQEDIPLRGFSRRGVSFAVIIKSDGTLVDINDMRDERSKAKQMIVPAAVIRTSNANQKPNFLCDSAKFVLGYEIDDPESGVEAHDNFCKLHEKIGNGLADEGMLAVLLFLRKWKPEQFAFLACLNKYKDEIATGNIVFKLESQSREYIHDRPAIKNAWLKHYSNSSSKYVAMCLVIGKKVQIAELHDGIKGVANPTHPVGAIISFNQDSFCSYGKDKSYNAPIGEEAMFNYTTVLNHMLRKESRQKVQIGDATTVFWAEGKTQVAEFLKDILDPREDTPNLSGLRLFLEAVRDGKNAGLSDEEKKLRFYILGLAPNAKRLSVRFWYVSTAEDISRKIGQHFSDLNIRRNYEDEPEYPGMWWLLVETLPKREGQKRKTEDISPLLAGAFARAILTGRAYPTALLQQIIERIRADGDLSYFRAALIKAYLTRNNRLLKQNRKGVGMSLEKEQRDIGYLLGRLFAVLEKAQKDAVSGANTTIKDRFYGSASATPAVVFPQLMRLAQHHIQKSQYGGLIEKAIEEITGNIQVFPAHLSLEEQGMFALGYYHQKPEMYKKTDKNEEVKQ